jgi:hypothetical protein
MLKAAVWLFVTITGLIGVVLFSYFLYDRLVLLPQDLENIDRRYCSDPGYAAFPDVSKAGTCSKVIAEHENNVTWMQQYQRERAHWDDLCTRQSC